MCILSFIPRGVEYTHEVEEELFNGGMANPHGFGWAIASDDAGIILGKSLNLDEALATFMEARDKHDGPALFHSRWATHGSVRVGNCHPFLIKGDHMTVLAHNGILPKDAHPGPGDDRSDTAILAEELLPRRWFRLDRKGVQKSLSQWCGSWNKLVILTVNPRYQKNVYLVNEKAGEWSKVTGLWHSNQDYTDFPRWMQNYVSRGWSSGKGSVRHQADQQLALEAASVPFSEMECHYCDQRIDPNGYCTLCGTCAACLEPQDTCLCYTPESAVKSASDSAEVFAQAEADWEAEVIAEAADNLAHDVAQVMFSD